MFIKLILLILFIPIIILITFLIVNVLPFPQALNEIKDQIAAVTAGIFSFGYLVFIFIYTIFSFRRAGRVFEKIFLKLNLKPANFRFFGRQYTGFIESRLIVIEYFPPRAIHRSLLNIYLNADMSCIDISSKKIPVFDNKKIKSCNIYSEDKTKFQELVADKGFKSCLDLILNNSNKNIIRQVYLIPDKIWFRMVFSSISESDLLVLIKNLFFLAEKIEDLGEK